MEGPSVRVAADPKGIMAKLGGIIKQQGLSLRQAFEVFDTNKDGKIEKREFMNTFRNVKANLSYAELEDLWTGQIKDQYGYLNYQEFCNSLEGSPIHSSRPGVAESVMKIRQRIA